MFCKTRLVRLMANQTDSITLLLVVWAATKHVGTMPWTRTIGGSFSKTMDPHVLAWLEVGYAVHFLFHQLKIPFRTATSQNNHYKPTLKHPSHLVTFPTQNPLHYLRRNNVLGSNHIEAQQGTPSLPNGINSLVSVFHFVLLPSLTHWLTLQ